MAAIKTAVETTVTRAAGYAFRVYRQPNFVNTFTSLNIFAGLSRSHRIDRPRIVSDFLQRSATHAISQTRLAMYGYTAEHLDNYVWHGFDDPVIK